MHHYCVFRFLILFLFLTNLWQNKWNRCFDRLPFDRLTHRDCFHKLPPTDCHLTACHLTDCFHRLPLTDFHLTYYHLTDCHLTDCYPQITFTNCHLTDCHLTAYHPQIHNAEQLADWCLAYLAQSYSTVCRR